MAARKGERHWKITGAPHRKTGAIQDQRHRRTIPATQGCLGVQTGHDTGVKDGERNRLRFPGKKLDKNGKCKTPTQNESEACKYGRTRGFIDKGVRAGGCRGDCR